MPASQSAGYQQFEVSAQPAWWLRRWTRFPLYFQATKPRFLLRVRRLEHGGDTQLKFYLAFADRSSRDFPVDVSELKVGESLAFKTPENLLAPSGDARVCLDFGSSLDGRRFETLYAFYVSNEATLTFLLLNVLFGGLVAIVIALVGLK